MADIKDITINTGKQDHVLFQDVCSIIEHGRQQAYGSVSQIAIATYWNVGKRIVEEEQNGEKRAAYGVGLMNPQKVNTCVHNLEWSHIRRVLSVTSPEARSA